MMAQGEWINSEPGIDGQQSSAQGPIQYNIANLAADFAGQMSSSLAVELPLGLRTPINHVSLKPFRINLLITCRQWTSLRTEICHR